MNKLLYVADIELLNYLFYFSNFVKTASRQKW